MFTIAFIVVQTLKKIKDVDNDHFGPLQGQSEVVNLATLWNTWLTDLFLCMYLAAYVRKLIILLYNYYQSKEQNKEDMPPSDEHSRLMNNYL